MSSLLVSRNAAIEIVAEADGVCYRSPLGRGGRWLEERLDDPIAEEVRAFLTQLDEAGLLEERESDGAKLLPWASVHDVIDEYRPRTFELPVPPVIEQRVPGLVCRGNISDRDFSIAIDRWYERADGGGAHELAERPAFVGPITVPGTREPLAFTMSRPVYELVQAVERFSSRDRASRDARVNREAFAEIRALALACGAELDAQFRRTFVLAPSDLWLAYRASRTSEDSADEGGVQVGVTPTFRDAPSTWRQAFRSRSRVPHSGVYKFTGDDGEYVEVVVREPVRTFLNAFYRRFPEGVASGPPARQLLSNPVALFGGDAVVLDVEKTEAAVAELRRTLWTFTPQVHPSDGRPIERVGLLLTPADGDSDASPRLEFFMTPARLRAFVSALRRALAAGDPVVEAFDCPIELSEREESIAERLERLADAWEAGRSVVTGAARDSTGTEPGADKPGQVLIDAAWVFDLSKYGDRVESIGVDLPFAIARISLAGKRDWVPDERELQMLVTFREGDARGDLRLLAADVDALRARCADAELRGEDTVELPDGRAMRLDQARALVDAMPHDLWQAAASSGHDGDGTTVATEPSHGESALSSPRTGAAPKVGLLYKANIDTREYAAHRAGDLDHRLAREPRLPRSLRAGVVLRSHQRRGVAWLQSLLARAPERCHGALLADDMGLGKTLQLLVVIASAHEDEPKRPPSLVVAPVSLLDNWVREIANFFESGTIKVQRLSSEQLAMRKAARHEIAPEMLEQGMDRFLRPGWRDEDTTIVLTTYEALRRYALSFAELDWSIVVCDEAQKIKNPNAMVSRAVKCLKATFCIAATGTPVENNLTDLWSIYDFVQPGLLEALNEFNHRYRRPIEADGERDLERLRELRETIRPQLMRRVKGDVLDALPDKRVDTACLSLPMSDVQRELYRQAVAEYHATPLAHRRAAVLTLLRRLRDVSADPLLAEALGRGQFPSLQEHRRVSPKLDWLLGALERIRMLEEKAIVFTGRKDLQRLLKHYIDECFDLNVFIVNGGTRAYGPDGRQSRIDAFQEAPGFNVIVLSPDATGVGLNIQGANHVIHYTRPWNPAKEDQATDRAYRIGQQRDVTVYTPIVTLDGIVTFEQRLHELLERKRQLAQDVLNGCEGVTEAELFEAIKDDLDKLELT